MNTNLTLTARFVRSLSRGKALTAKQARNLFGFSTTNSVRATVSNLRRNGMKIDTVARTNSKGRTRNRYTMTSAV